jgi:outer membrane protein assembly factor BamB
LTALNMDGTVRWQVAATPEMSAVDFAMAVGSTVLGTSTCQLDPMAGMWDLESGEQLAQGPLGSFDFPAFVAGDLGVVQSWESGEFRVVDMVTGQERWSSPFVGYTWPIGDLVLVETDQGFEARALDTGAVRWTQTSPELREVSEGVVPYYYLASWDDERAYLGAAGVRGYSLIALSLADGTIVWTAPMPPADEGGIVAVAEGLVFGNAADGGAIEARDVRTGELVWNAPGSIPFRGGVHRGLAGDGNLYAHIDDGDAAALDARSGQVRWRASDDDVLSTGQVDPLAAIPGGLLARHHGPDGEDLVALDAADGTVLWRRPAPLGTQITTDGNVVLLAASGCDEGGG